MAVTHLLGRKPGLLRSKQQRGPLGRGPGAACVASEPPREFVKRDQVAVKIAPRTGCRAHNQRGVANRLTVHEGLDAYSRWSPDGKWIAFDHHHETHSQIYLIDSEGRNMHAVTTGNYENAVPGWSRDGTAVYFASNHTGSWQLWRRELATVREAQVTHHGGFAAFESYDAKTLYYSKFEGGGIWSMPVGGGEERQVTDALHKGYWGHFAVTDTGLYLLNSEAAPKPTLMFYNFQTRLLTPVLQLEDSFPSAVNLAASRDGRTLWSAQQAARHSSLTMAENFQ